ncbi:Putative oxidoreductase YdbC [Mycobacterium europaeum]|uniref:Putative oxidoreductase YdbC n=1 Tax=Mycobacterium europaeum TaxID=761804 RepID=A0A0U1DTB3_9MYCO|nr:aldo/keto reductase [Mycobacterium europaeum]CQD22326.1 Putative oxidoreductase YdbC [Mycobacterium europaeum]
MARTARELVLGLHRTRVDEHLLTAARDLGVEHLDTAYNYGGFRSLDRLAALRAPCAFKITSKVGFFRSPDSAAEHSLTPARLYSAVEDTVARLGAPLDVILLHNPERAGPASPLDFPHALASACHSLQRAVRDGLARRWGLSIWKPQALLDHLQGLILEPDVLMTRVGLSVSASDMAAIESCRDALTWPGIEHRGMAPLGGASAPTLLRATDLSSFVHGDATNAQAGVRISFDLPPVDLVTLGTSNAVHLRYAVMACAMDVDDERLTVYRGLLRALARDPDARG